MQAVDHFGFSNTTDHHQPLAPSLGMSLPPLIPSSLPTRRAPSSFDLSHTLVLASPALGPLLCSLLLVEVASFCLLGPYSVCSMFAYKLGTYVQIDS
mmetsp:Transcript_35698/g.86700  ORF Transcript_35698/g.86700 Transcript_35698/m.86700 type:complete len:97 (-) Transcript_35698:91-381(-)